jgi:hypothetical protein
MEHDCGSYKQISNRDLRFWQWCCWTFVSLVCYALLWLSSLWRWKGSYIFNLQGQTVQKKTCWLWWWRNYFPLECQILCMKWHIVIYRTTCFLNLCTMSLTRWSTYVHINFWICITCVLLIMCEIVMAVVICFQHFITLFMIIYDKPCFRVYYQVINVLLWDFFIKLLPFTILYKTS